VRGAGPDAVVSGEVLDQAAEIRMDRPRGHDGAGVGRLRDPQRLHAVAADAGAHAERQFVAVGVVGQSVEPERATVAHGRPAGLVREPVHRLKWAAIHLERSAGVVRRRAGFSVGERFRWLFTGQGG